MHAFDSSQNDAFIVIKGILASKLTKKLILGKAMLLYLFAVLYAIVLVFVFLLLPFSYFFYEEGDEHERTPVRTVSVVNGNG